MFIHDRTTVVVGKWLTFWSFLALVLFSGLGFSGNWLGQSPPPFIVHEVTRINFGNGQDGLRVVVMARPRQFGGRVPSDFDIAGKLSDDLAKFWRFESAAWALTGRDSVYLTSNGKQQLVWENTQLTRDEDSASASVPVYFRGLPIEDGTYLLRFDLLLWDNNAIDEVQTSLAPTKNTEGKETVVTRSQAIENIYKTSKALVFDKSAFTVRLTN